MDRLKLKNRWSFPEKWLIHRIFDLSIFDEAKHIRTSNFRLYQSFKLLNRWLVTGKWLIYRLLVRANYVIQDADDVRPSSLVVLAPSHLSLILLPVPPTNNRIINMISFLFHLQCTYLDYLFTHAAHVCNLLGGVWVRLPLVVCVKEQPIKLDSVVLKKQLCVGQTIGNTSDYVTKIKKSAFGILWSYINYTFILTIKTSRGDLENEFAKTKSPDGMWTW